MSDRPLHGLEHFQFSDPINKEAATRYRLLKKRKQNAAEVAEHCEVLSK